METVSDKAAGELLATYSYDALGNLESVLTSNSATD